MLERLVPWVTFRLAGDADKLKLGGGVTVSASVVVLVKLPEVPATVTVAVPVVAVLVARSVKVLEVVAGLGLKIAVMPLGRPDTDRLTLRLNPFCGVTVIKLVPLVPCATPRLFGDAERV